MPAVEKQPFHVIIFAGTFLRHVELKTIVSVVKSMLRAKGTSLQTLSRTFCTAQWDMVRD